MKAVVIPGGKTFKHRGRTVELGPIHLDIQKDETVLLLDSVGVSCLVNYLGLAVEELEARLEADRHHPDYSVEDRERINDNIRRAMLWSRTLEESTYRTRINS